jgi:P2 family phage major capsid protein
MNLSANAKAKVKDLFVNTAKAYDGEVGDQYSATPTVAQTLMNKIVEDGSWFLKMINMVPVTEISGDKVSLFTSARVGGRTEITGSAERVPKDLADTVSKLYQLYFAEYDTAIPYAKVDAWAKFKDFVQRYNNAIRVAIGNDRVTTGWNGTSAAATTNIGTSPNLEDFNIGWLKQIRDFSAGSQYLNGTAGAVELGSVAFPNLDTIVFEGADSLESPYRDSPDLVALVSRDLVSAAEGEYFATAANTPTEKIALDKEAGLIRRTFGALPTYIPPFFPNGTVLITSFNNLSIYYQDTSVRRTQKDKPEKNRLEDFLSLNEGFVVEDFRKTFLIQNISIAP